MTELEALEIQRALADVRIELEGLQKDLKERFKDIHGSIDDAETTVDALRSKTIAARLDGRKNPMLTYMADEPDAGGRQS